MIGVGSIVNGKYRIVRVLGDGGMGSVYEAVHAVLGTRVAIKVLHPELARRTGLVERFLQEARVAAQIRSPHVVQVTDVDRTPDGQAYIVMELLEGEPLSAVLDRQRKLPVKIVVYNNGALGFVEIEMKAAGLVDFGTTLDNPDFAQMARAIGIHGERVEDPGELPGAVRSALAHDGPALLDVVVNRQELAMPPTIELEQAKGFTLYMMNAVLSGRGDEVLDLAKTNLWR